jgi:3'(2'), 5'-bisphosphate nucleotidase
MYLILLHYLNGIIPKKTLEIKLIENIDIEDIKNIAKRAAVEIMKIYDQDFTVKYKDDKSPLTEADLKANEIICTNLAKLTPNIPIMSEENMQIEYKDRKDWKYYWCIDPIDGTKEFVKKNGEFTINIALIDVDTPILGVVYAPACDKMYSAKKGNGAYLNGKKLPIKREDESYVVVSSKSHLSAQTQKCIHTLKSRYKDLRQASLGSSLKLCMVADGSADIYPRVSPTSEWDTAAADAILREAGKMTYIYDESLSIFDYIDKKDSIKKVVYNKENLLNPFFVVC